MPPPRRFRISGHAKIGIGGLWAFSFVPGPLEASYAGDPSGAMAFIRLEIG